MAVLDSTTLLYLLDPTAKAPIDPDTKLPVANAKNRIDSLMEALQDRREAVVVPTPVLSEVLVHADEAAPEYLSILSETSRFRIVPFDERAAIELAEMTRRALSKGDLRAGTNSTRAKLKFDRQILAIARVEDECHIYTDDGDMCKVARAEGFDVTATRDIPLRTQQTTLPV